MSITFYTRMNRQLRWIVEVPEVKQKVVSRQQFFPQAILKTEMEMKKLGIFRGSCFSVECRSDYNYTFMYLETKLSNDGSNTN